MTQNGNFIFATFFVYGPTSAPIWYTAQLTLDSSGSFTGPLYATTGPWFGTVPFDSRQVAINQVGNATFQPTAADAGVLAYNVASTQVVKNIQRQTLVPISLSGSYAGGVAVNDASCPDPTDNGPANLPANVLVTQNQAGQVQIVLSILGIASCTFANTGVVTQAGQLFAFPAMYTCSYGSSAATPVSAAVTVSELRVTGLGIEGRWTSPNVGGCLEDGRFGGVLQY